MIINPADRLSHVSEYYFSEKLRAIARLNQGGANIINLGIGSPDLPPSREVILTMNEWVEEKDAHGYQSYIGLPELREQIAIWLHEHYAVSFKYENEILPLIGSKEGIMHISMAFLSPGDKVLIPNPGYPTYASVSELVQAEVISYDLDEASKWEINWDSFERLPLSDVKLVWVNFPNMPTGARGSIKQFKRLIDCAKKYGFLIVNDNPYDKLFSGQGLSIFQVDGAKEVCLELSSLSKSHNMAGWRLGWVAGHADYIQTILKVKSNMDSGMFLPIQKAAVKALKLPEKWYEDLNDIYAGRRKLALGIMQLLGCKFDTDQGGLFVWGKAPEYIPSVSDWIDQIIDKARVFITPGFIFGSNGERYIRISLCANEEILRESHLRISEFMDSRV
ncbi:MAG: aminotransferase class I/II-fold pyridoxal phosphate-dependent enzyme [Bacteroidota bacterium]